MVSLILAVTRQLHSTFIGLDICFLHMHFHIGHLEWMCVCGMCEQMSNVMRSEMKGGGWEAASLQGHLTGVTLTADWLIPPSSEPSHDA